MVNIADYIKRVRVFNRLSAKDIFFLIDGDAPGRSSLFKEILKNEFMHSEEMLGVIVAVKFV